MKSKRAATIGIALSTVLVCAAVVAAKQQGATPPAAQAAQDSVQTGINVVKTIVTAEVVQDSRHGHFSGWADLYHSPDAQQFWQRMDIAAGPDVVPGWMLSLVVSADGAHFQISLHNAASKCGLSVFSSDDGTVYEAGWVNCVQLLPPSGE